jgi:hypothetical protein
LLQQAPKFTHPIRVIGCYAREPGNKQTRNVDEESASPQKQKNHKDKRKTTMSRQLNTWTKRDRSSQNFFSKAQTAAEKGNPQEETPKPKVADIKKTGTATHIDQTPTKQQQQ